MIPVVIVHIAAQKPMVKRFVNYCKRLDNTEILVLQIESKYEGGDDRFIRASRCFDLAARELRNTEFFWIEADAIPLKAGWLSLIEKEYRREGKKYLLPDIKGLPSGDMASAIGIYP